MPEGVPPEQRLALLDAVLMNSPMGAASIDQSLRYVFVNDALAQMHGLPAESHFGKEDREVVPRLWSTLEPVLRSVLNGQTVLNSTINLEVAGVTHETRYWLTSLYPIRVSEEIVAIESIANNVTAMQQREGALRLCTRIYEVLSRTTQTVSKGASEGRSTATSATSR